MTVSGASRDRLRILGDVMMPRHGSFPSFCEADPDGAMLDAALEELRRDVPRILALIDDLEPIDDRAATDPDVSAEAQAWLRDLRTTDPEGFEILRVLIVGTYLSCQPVWGVLGYPGRVDNPVRDDEESIWLVGDVGASDPSMDLLEPVRRRGPIYRATPSK